MPKRRNRRYRTLNCEALEDRRLLTNAFDIDINFLTSIDSQGNTLAFTAAEQTTIQQAASRWEAIITQDVPDTVLPSGTVVDDILIDFALDEFLDDAGVPDGPGGTLPGFYNTFSQLPVTADIFVDVADRNIPDLLDTLKHEIGHAVGISPFFWSLQGLANGGAYTGMYASVEYNSEFQLGQCPCSIPLESQHWSETILRTELMTPSARLPGTMGVTNPLSRISVGALKDLGYVVDFSAADNYFPLSWQNENFPEDVTNDSNVFTIDALLVIQYLREYGVGAQFPQPPVLPLLPELNGYADVDNSGFATVNDILLVVNYLRNPPAAATAQQGTTSQQVTATQQGATSAQLDPIQAITDELIAISLVEDGPNFGEPAKKSTPVVRRSLEPPQRPRRVLPTQPVEGVKTEGGLIIDYAPVEQPKVKAELPPGSKGRPLTERELELLKELVATLAAEEGVQLDETGFALAEDVAVTSEDVALTHEDVALTGKDVALTGKDVALARGAESNVMLLPPSVLVSTRAEPVPSGLPMPPSPRPARSQGPATTRTWLLLSKVVQEIFKSPAERDDQALDDWIAELYELEPETLRESESLIPPPVRLATLGRQNAPGDSKPAPLEFSL